LLGWHESSVANQGKRHFYIVTPAALKDRLCIGTYTPNLLHLKQTRQLPPKQTVATLASPLVASREYSASDRGGHRFGAIRYLELIHNIVHMMTNCVVADIQASRNFFVGRTFCKQFENR